MASGFGAKGSEGRCYPLWQGFSKVGSFFSRSAARLFVGVVSRHTALENGIENRIESLFGERREVFFFRLFFFGLWGHFRFGVREETIFSSSSSFSSGWDSLPPPRKQSAMATTRERARDV